ncbi:MAG TPA: restriction endonuclease, partial [Gemmataceae bacterium]|nr:restriction endonuclease [Gemmataceae bacterium]
MSTNRRGSGARSRSKSASSKSPPWREFEKAVASFVASTDPRAKVTHNAFTPDGQTQRPRQRDVWVEGTIGSFPLKILVSCKRYKRRLDEDHIDAFSGVVRNSGAHLGVLYSYSGFTEPAVEKAKKLQPAIECCRLFTYQPAELPEVL